MYLQRKIDHNIEDNNSLFSSDSECGEENDYAQYERLIDYLEIDTFIDTDNIPFEVCLGDEIGAGDGLASIAVKINI